MELRDLEPLEFDLNEWVRAFNWKVKSVMVRVPAKTNAAGVTVPAHFVMLPLFAHVFVGFDNIPDPRWQEHLLGDLWRFNVPAFKCPAAWSMAKILGALKAFSSVGDAKRNGWDFRSEQGWEDHKVRIAKNQGIITVITPTDAVLALDTF